MLESYFDYLAYLHLARELATCDSECDRLHDAKWRSSISRAYYAAFLHLRQFQMDRDITHGDLLAWARGKSKQLDRNMRELKTFREDCDYDKPIAYDLGDKAQECIDVCQDIFDELDSLFGNSSD